MFQRLPDRAPTSFEWKIFKWIFMPLIIAGLVMYFWRVSSGKWKCEAYCKEEGHTVSVYVPRDGVIPASCSCGDSTQE